MINPFKLEPVDILVTINDRQNPYSVAKRWALGSPYDHVFMYMGQMSILVDNVVLRHPFLFESNGRGVVIQSLSNRYGQKVVVMRLKSEYDRKRIPIILEEAIKLASEPGSYYDYYAIASGVLPRILREKFHLPLPIKYQRDARQICSEALNEIFLRALLTLFLYWDIPLPGDYVTGSLLLEEVQRGILSEDWV
jgi:hypothetical protein